ncbi:GNAT family protein [Actinophytocola sp.]|uniref:GNAT family N-acetyltransferase n=1 Tax=Actinophytocola sp. TaxID=1872138 RepID=UPI002ED15973
MEFRPVADVATLLNFLTAEEWPFHVVTKPDPARIRNQYAQGDYATAFWIVDGGVTVGLVRLMDLDNGTPLFDLRVATAARGRGVGEAAVRWLTSHVFTGYDTNRIEATTRQDNHAMRRVLAKAGYVKEAHYRDAWPGQEGVHDAIGYAILRRDWKAGTTTEVNWADA